MKQQDNTKHVILEKAAFQASEYSYVTLFWIVIASVSIALICNLENARNSCEHMNKHTETSLQWWK